MTKKQVSQRERFEQTARELGVELDEEKVKEAFRKIAPRQAASTPDKVLNTKPKVEPRS